MCVCVCVSVCVCLTTRSLFPDPVALRRWAIRPFASPSQDLIAPSDENVELSDVLAAPVVCVVRQVRWRALAAPVVCVVWQVRWQALRESLLLAAPVVCVVRQVRWQALQKALVLQGLGSALDPPLQALQALQ